MAVNLAVSFVWRERARKAHLEQIWKEEIEHHHDGIDMHLELGIDLNQQRYPS